MPGLILAVVNPDNTPHGYQLTYAFPMILFLAIIAILYLLFTRPHRRVPPRRISPAAASSAALHPDAARAASIAGGLSLGAGGGATESVHEATGAHLAASAEADNAAESGDGEDSETAAGGQESGTDSKEAE